MGEENESFYDNLFLESVRNNQEIPICRIENIPKTPLTGSTFLLTIRKHCRYIRKHGKRTSRISG